MNTGSEDNTINDSNIETSWRNLEEGNFLFEINKIKNEPQNHHRFQHVLNKDIKKIIAVHKI